MTTQTVLFLGLQEVVLNDTSASSPKSQAKPMRGPMQWSNKTNAGFCPECLAKPWMDIHPSYKTDMNVEVTLASLSGCRVRLVSDNGDDVLL